MHFSLQSWDNHGSYQFQKIASCALHLFWAGTQLGVWVPQVKSALISNNQGEVPLPRQSRATSHMFLTHRPALHHVLIIATTRDVTLERQQAAALGAEVKTAKLYIRTLKKEKKKTGCVQNPEKFQRESQKSTCRCWFHAKKFVIPSVATFVIFPNYWSPLFCWLEPGSYIIGLCLLWVWIQPWWMEVLWYSPIRRQAFLWPCPLMHY